MTEAVIINNNNNNNNSNSDINSKVCKMCNNHAIIYAHDLCTTCYYRYYMQMWRKKQVNEQTKITLKQDDEYQYTIRQIRELIDNMLLLSEQEHIKRLRELINRCANKLYQLGLRGNVLIKQLADDIQRLDKFIIIKYLDRQYLQQDNITNDLQHIGEIAGEDDEGDKATDNLVVYYIQLINDFLTLSYKFKDLARTLQQDIAKKKYKEIDTLLLITNNSTTTTDIDIDNGNGNNSNNALIVKDKLLHLHRQASKISALLSSNDRRTKLTNISYVLMLMFSLGETYRSLAKLFHVSTKWTSIILNTTYQLVSNNNNNNNNNNDDDNNIDYNNPTYCARKRIQKLLDEGFYVTIDDRDIKQGERINILRYVLNEIKK